MTAAAAASSRGASVVVLERGVFTGGTTAKSGGVLWIPNNPFLRERGLTDDRADALRYMARTAYPTLYNPEHATLGLPADKHALLEAFYDNGSVAIEELLASGALVLESLDYPDYAAELPEDTTPIGRTLQPRLPDGWRRGVDPSGGQYLVDQLQAAAERAGATVLLEHRAAHLVRNEDLEVVGLEVQVGRRTELFGARRGIVFASGGFLHNRRLTLEYLRGPVLGGAAAEGSTGDFVDIGIEVGAQLGNMSHAWWDQVVAELAVRVPETIKDVYEPFGDSMVIVDRRGRRVVNEKVPYNERSQVHFDWDPVRREYPNLLLFMIWDEAVASEHRPLPLPLPRPAAGRALRLRDHGADLRRAPGRDRAAAGEAGARGPGASAWTRRSRTAWPRPSPASTRTPATATTRTSTAGRRRSSRRGPARRGQGAPTGAMHPFAAEGPYHCVILGPGALDTKGGPVVDDHARVLTPAGEPIVGLYGAGNCIASPAGQAYWGAGGTIGLALTYGYLAGCHAAAEPARTPS